MGTEEEVGELFRELERLELLLSAEKRRSEAMEDEKAAAQEGHRRDVQALESMLNQQALQCGRLETENKQLRSEIAVLRLQREIQAGRLDGAKLHEAFFGKSDGGSNCTSRSPLEEPELEHTSQTDTNSGSDLLGQTMVTSVPSIMGRNSDPDILDWWLPAVP